MKDLADCEIRTLAAFPVIVEGHCVMIIMVCNKVHTERSHILTPDDMDIAGLIVDSIEGMLVEL